MSFDKYPNTIIFIIIIICVMAFIGMPGMGYVGLFIIFLICIPLILLVKTKDDDKIKIEENAKRDKEYKRINSEKEERKKRESEEHDIQRKVYHNQQLEKYHILRKSLISKFDKDQNGEIDLIQDNDFGKLLKKHQSQIVEIDKTYIQKFVKISNFLSFKKKSISELYSQLFILEKINTKDISEEHWRMRNPSMSNFHRLNDIDDLIQIEIHTYESVIFHSISMVTALLKNDLLTFYEIFESFDKLGIFNTNWENDISVKLSNIEDKLDDLIDSIKQLEYRISNSLDSLSYTTESSFKELNKSVSGQLSEIGSSLKFNNLLTGIQVYQTSKLNKSIKRLN